MGGGWVAAVLVGQGRGAAEVAGTAAVVDGEALTGSAVLVDVAGCVAKGTFAIQGALLAGNQLVVRDLCGAAGAEGTVRPGGVGVDGSGSGSGCDVLRTGSKGSGYFETTVSLLRSSKGLPGECI